MKFFGAFALFAVAAAVDQNKVHWTALTGQNQAVAVNKVVSAPVQYVHAAPLQRVQYVHAAPAHHQYLRLIPLQTHAPTVQYVQAHAPAVQYVQAAHVAHAHHGPIVGAVQSSRTVQVVDGPSAAPAEAQTIVFPPSSQPLDFEFQSQSSPISVRQTHIPGRAAETQEANHEEPADVLRQTIVKPIVHEVRESIQPIRRISQEVRPVQEHINQVLTRGQVQAQAVVKPVQVQTVQVAQVQPVQVAHVQAVPVRTLQAVQLTRPIQYVNAQIARPTVVALNTVGNVAHTSVVDAGATVVDASGAETVEVAEK